MLHNAHSVSLILIHWNFFNFNDKEGVSTDRKVCAKEFTVDMLCKNVQINACNISP